MKTEKKISQFSLKDYCKIYKVFFVLTFNLAYFLHFHRFFVKKKKTTKNNKKDKGYIPSSQFDRKLGSKKPGYSKSTTISQILEVTQ